MCRVKMQKEIKLVRKTVVIIFASLSFLLMDGILQTNIDPNWIKSAQGLHTFIKKSTLKMNITDW